MKATREMMIAAENKDIKASKLKVGARREGRPWGILPTTSPPPISFISPFSIFLICQ